MSKCSKFSWGPWGPSLFQKTLQHHMLKTVLKTKSSMTLMWGVPLGAVNQTQSPDGKCCAGPHRPAPLHTNKAHEPLPNALSQKTQIRAVVKITCCLWTSLGSEISCWAILPDHCKNEIMIQKPPRTDWAGVNSVDSLTWDNDDDATTLTGKPHARKVPVSFIHINSFNSHNNSTKWVLSSSHYTDETTVGQRG